MKENKLLIFYSVVAPLFTNVLKYKYTFQQYLRITSSVFITSFQKKIISISVKQRQLPRASWSVPMVLSTSEIISLRCTYISMKFLWSISITIDIFADGMQSVWCFSTPYVLKKNSMKESASSINSIMHFRKVPTTD